MAAGLARRLGTGQKALAVALAAVVEVNAGLVAIATRPHLTTPCHVGVHEACRLTCSCEDCLEPCECPCHEG